MLNLFLFKTNIKNFTTIFQGLFKNIVFRSVAAVIKKLCAILDFFLHRQDFLLPCTLPYAKKEGSLEIMLTVLLTIIELNFAKT